MGFWEQIFSAAIAAPVAVMPVQPHLFTQPAPDSPLTDADIIKGIIVREGSAYVDNPADRGGPTKYGVTQAALSSFRGHPVTVDDVKSLTAEEATAIYELDFISRPGFDLITYAPLRTAVIDAGVNSSPREAVLMLQRALGVPADGVMGPQTIAATKTAVDVTRRFAIQRTIFYGNICKQTPSQWEFYDGWVARAINLI